MRVSLILICLAFLLAACDPNPESSLSFETLPETGDPVRGELLFTQDTNPPCSACHTTNSSASPNLTGFGERAGTQVEGESAREYAFYSITEPGRFIAEGFGNAMPNTYDDDLTAQDIADLIAYLLNQ